MTGPAVSTWAYRNGEIVPEANLTVAVQDAGFVQGLTVAEQLRTFDGELFRLPEHLRRLRHSLEIVGVRIPETDEQLTEAAERLAAHNREFLQPGDDLALVLFVTPGPYAAMAAGAPSGPVRGMHTYPLPFAGWVGKYASGQALATTNVLQIPAACWPRELKCRSRMHYHLADQAAAKIDPQARALLLDQDGFVVEASTANVILYRESEGLISPPAERILPGVTLRAWEDIAGALGIPFLRRDVNVQDVRESDEVLLCSTSMCGLPAVRLNGQDIGGGSPGPCFARLIQAFSELVGLDIVQQARQFCER